MTPPDLPPPVEVVVVRTAQLPPSPSDAAFSIVRLDPAGQPRLDEALAASPGAGLFRRTSSLGANPTTQGLSLREIAPSGAGRALVLLDGAPQNDPFGGWVIWSALPTESIATVDLARGAGAGPYGAGALTGVASLHSLDGDAEGVDVYAGDLDRRLGGAFSRSGKRVDVLLTAAAAHSDGWTPVRERRGGADRPLTLDAASAALRLQADMGSAVVSARAGGYREARGSGLAGAASRAEGFSASLALARTDAQGPGWRLQGWVQRSDLRNRSVAVAAERTATNPANDQYATPATGYGLNAAVRGPGAAWEAGLDIRTYEGESRERFRYLGGSYTRHRTAGGRTAIAGAYAEGRHDIGPWMVTGGVRLDYWSNSEGRRSERDNGSGAPILEASAPDHNGWLPTARVGVRRAVGEGWVRAAAYAGFRPPTLNELHRPFRVGNDITEANAALQPERLHGVEAGVDGPGWSATLFYNRLIDPVTNVTIGAGPGTFPIAGFVPAGGALRQRRNVGAIEAYGLEAEGRRRIGHGLSASAALAYTVAEVDGGAAAPQLTGLRPAQAPRFSGRLALEWTGLDTLFVSVAVRHEGLRFDDDINSRRLGAFTAADARLGFDLGRGRQVYLAVDNLTDEAVPTGQTADGVFSYGPPRTARIGFTLRR